MNVFAWYSESVLTWFIDIMGYIFLRALVATTLTGCEEWESLILL